LWPLCRVWVRSPRGEGERVGALLRVVCRAFSVLRLALLLCLLSREVGGRGNRSGCVACVWWCEGVGSSGERKFMAVRRLAAAAVARRPPNNTASGLALALDGEPFSPF